MELVDRWADVSDGQMDGQMGMETQTDGYGVGARRIGIEKWVGWQTNRWTDRRIGGEIDKNRWGVGQKVALGQQVGGIGGQLIVGGNGSPGWVVITRSGVCVESGKTERMGLKLLCYLLCLQGSDTEEKESRSSVTSSPNDKQIDPSL